MGESALGLVGPCGSASESSAESRKEDLSSSRLKRRRGFTPGGVRLGRNVKKGEVMAQNVEAPSETELAEFQQKLTDFEATLTPGEKQQLAGMIVLATDAQDEEETKKVSGETTLPSDEEMDAFAKKLDEFHDSLPGEQHRVLDAIVGHAWAGDADDVQGYYYIWSGWINANRRSWRSYWRACDYQGGDLYNWGTANYGGRIVRNVGCWVDA